jgi:hypothetical protein
LPRISTGKRTVNKETSLATPIPKPAVLQLEVRMTQDLCHGKVDITSFPEIPSFPNPTSGARSIELGKNNENKPKCWKIANNSYPVYHLCAQRLPNPYNEFLKSLHLFEEGNFIYDKVLSVHQDLIRADRNPCRKTRKNHPKCKK